MKIERIVITGGRNFADADRIEADLRALLPLGLRRVAQGGNGIDRQCGGAETPEKFESADTLAWLATHALHLEEATYWVNMTPTDGALGDAHIPQWTGADGKWPAAGNRRNVRMLEAEKPDLVLAYPDPTSKGTWHCVREAIRRSHPVVIHHAFCSSADLLDPRITAGVIDGNCMLRVSPAPHRTLYIPATAESRREWSALFADL